MEDRDVCINSSTNCSEPRPVVHSEKISISQGVGDFDCSFTRINKQGTPALLACIKVPAQLISYGLPTLLHHAEELNIRLPLLRVSVRELPPTVGWRLAGQSSQKSFSQKSSSQKSSSQKHSSHNQFHPWESGSLFVLHGLFCGAITTQSMSDFLSGLTQDFQMFMAYAQAHNIRLESGGTAGNVT